MFIVSMIVGVCLAFAVLAIRIKASKRPVSEKKILLPPMFMSTGFLMFLFPPFRPPLWEVISAFLVGCLFSIFLIKTSRFETRGAHIYLKRSKAFIFVLLGLLVLRTVMKAYVGGEVTVEVTGGLFFILAFGMIAPWRIGMWIGYKKQEKQLQNTNSIMT